MTDKKDTVENNRLVKNKLANYIVQAYWLKNLYHLIKTHLRFITALPFTRRLISFIVANNFKINALNNEQAAVIAEASKQLDSPPWKRRKSLLGKIRLYMEANDIVAAIKLAVYQYNSAEFDCAILEVHKKSFLSMLRKMADDLPELEVLTGKGDTVQMQAKPDVIKNADIYEADWCKVGISAPWDKAKDGYVRFLFIAQEARGFLALYRNARKVDWNREFEKLSTADFFFVAGENKVPSIIGEVDVVYTWVDASDPAWQKEREKNSVAENINLVSAANDERYLDRDELKYSLRSLYLYAPFVRNIYIVTANQVPSWLNRESGKVRIVSHKDIFPEEQMLPTFNSHSIEACLHRIKGLSEYFIYFNDDMFLGSEVSVDDFFTTAALLKIYLSKSHRIFGGQPLDNAIPTDWAAYNANALIKRDYKLGFDRKLRHYPYALKKSIMEEIEQRYPQEIRQTRLSKFRSNKDLALPSMFSAFYSIATRQGVEWPDNVGEYVYADTGAFNLYKNLADIEKQRPRFFCLNSTSIRDISLKHQAQLIKEFLEYYYPISSPYERESNDAL